MQTVFLLREPSGGASELTGDAATAPTVNMVQVGATAHSKQSWKWAWLSIALWSFPQMALGLSGFEMIMTVVPQVSGGAGGEAGTAVGPCTQYAQVDARCGFDHGRIPCRRRPGHDMARAGAKPSVRMEPPSIERWPTWHTVRRWPMGPMARP